MAVLVGHLSWPVLRCYRSIPTDQLVAFWPFGEATGATRVDAQGDNDLADHGTVTSVAGPGAVNAVEFDGGGSQWLDIADDPDLSMGNGQAYTLSLWVWIDTNTSGATVLTHGTSVFNATHFAYRLFILDISGDNCFVFQQSDGTDVTTTSCNLGELDTGEWIHIAAWYDPSGNTMNIAANNGTPVSTTANNRYAQDSAHNFAIGAASTGGGDFDGKVALVRIYKKVLSATERLALFEEP